MFAEKQPINNTELKYQLERLLETSFDYVTSSYISSGYTGGVYEVEIKPRVAGRSSLIIKRVSSASELNLYHDFLEPYNLRSPGQLGVITIAGDQFLVIEKIEQVPLAEDNTWLDMALAWLIHKDSVCTTNIGTLSTLDCISPAPSSGDKWWPIIEECVRSGKHKNIEMNLYSKLNKLRSVLSRYMIELSAGRQTVVHYDFQKRNTLVDKDYKLFVIDWSNPSIGSPFIDLARLTRANLKQATYIKAKYTEAFPTSNYDELMRIADFRNTLSIFTWMCKAIVDGQLASVETEYSIDEYIKLLTEHIAIGTN